MSCAVQAPPMTTGNATASRLFHFLHALHPSYPTSLDDIHDVCRCPRRRPFRSPPAARLPGMHSTHAPPARRAVSRRHRSPTAVVSPSPAAHQRAHAGRIGRRPFGIAADHACEIRRELNASAAAASDPPACSSAPPVRAIGSVAPPSDASYGRVCEQPPTVDLEEARQRLRLGRVEPAASARSTNLRAPSPTIATRSTASAGAPHAQHFVAFRQIQPRIDRRSVEVENHELTALGHAQIDMSRTEKRPCRSPSPIVVT